MVGSLRAGEFGFIDTDMLWAKNRNLYPSERGINKAE